MSDTLPPRKSRRAPAAAASTSAPTPTTTPTPTPAPANAPAEPSAEASGATLTFHADWREQQQGNITAGSSVLLQYEPERLAELAGAGEIVGYAKFLPGGQLRHWRLVRRPASGRKGGKSTVARAAVGAEIPVPAETRHIELWFQGIDPSGSSRWDSRFGANYRFDVVKPAPANADEVKPRPGTTTNAEIVRVAVDAAVKANAATSRPGYPAGMLDLQTTLRVSARVDSARTLPSRASAARKKAAAESTRVWIDVHAFEGAAAFLKAETLPLVAAGLGDDGAALFVLEGLLYQGSVATPGSVTPRPDVRTVHYRLYAEIGGKIYTDGVLHECFLATDTVSG